MERLPCRRGLPGGRPGPDRRRSERIARQAFSLSWAKSGYGVTRIVSTSRASKDTGEILVGEPCCILGIDPGTRAVGYGVIEAAGSRLAHRASGCIRAKGAVFADRLVQIHRGLQEVIAAHQPDVAAVETVFGGKNLKTSIAIGEGRGVAIVSAAELGVPVVAYEPATVKRAVAGSGRAAKEQIREMVRVTLGLREAPKSEHAADALALAITHVHRQRTVDLASRGGGRRRRRR